MVISDFFIINGLTSFFGEITIITIFRRTPYIRETTQALGYFYGIFFIHLDKSTGSHDDGEANRNKVSVL